MNENGFAERIRELRIERELSCEELGRLIGVTKSTISFWENGITEPKASYVIALSKVFDVSADYILGISNFI